MEHEYQEWYNTIASYERGFKEWESRVDRIVKRYRDDSRTRNNPNARFNILWSNVQTITPAIFARLPRPDVRRRFRDNDPVARVASMMLLLKANKGSGSANSCVGILDRSVSSPTQRKDLFVRICSISWARFIIQMYQNDRLFPK